MTEIRALVVDDEPKLLEDLRWTAKEATGGTVCTANGAVQALELIQANGFSLVVTDLWMENRDSGLEVICAAKRKDARTQVILVTAFGRPDPMGPKAIAAGAYDYVDRTAPGSYLSRLRELIAQALEAREQSQE